jgi:hypothetical protein
MKNVQKQPGKGFAIFKQILENKKAIEQALKEGKSLNEIKGVKIAKPL